MTERIYQLIELKKLKANPWNPRKNYEGQKFEDLKNSILTKGVLEPILVRPLKKDKYEIVAGERRWKASCSIAESNGGLNGQTIPAIIQEMDDDTALEIMTIENLQREDLTELEEANNYKLLVDRKGPDFIPQLAEKLGITSAYIRRRINVLKNPEAVLKAWEAGKIKYGHCEELARLSDDKEILAYLKRITMKDDYDPKIGEKIESVRELREEINSQSLELAAAKFDIKEECLSCGQNSDQQKKLFGEAFDAKKSHCLNPKCFKQKQNNYFTANWKKLRGKSGTNGFRFYENCSYGEFNEFGTIQGIPGAKCKECPQFVSRIDITGKVMNSQICIGKKECYNEARAQSKKDEKKNQAQAVTESGAAAPDPDEPRVAWHGEHFREEFYKKRIPEVYEQLPRTDIKVRRFILASLIHSNNDLKDTFSRRHKLGQRYCWVQNDDVWKVIEAMSPEQVDIELYGAALVIVMQMTFGASARHALAVHMGIDLATEWRLHREYLEKKTTKEMLSMGERLGIFEDERAQKFLYEVLLKKRKKFNTCKKDELIRVFLDSGVDLAGKVPKEILNVGDKDVPEEVDDPLFDEPACRICGCTEDHACEGGCVWVEDPEELGDLCSACLDKVQKQD